VRINHGERGDEINMGIRVRFVFVEPQMNHVCQCDGEWRRSG
jgi:hypothetical protein